MTKVVGFKASQISPVVGRWSFVEANEGKLIQFTVVAVGIRKMLHEFVDNGVFGKLEIQ